MSDLGLGVKTVNLDDDADSDDDVIVTCDSELVPPPPDIAETDVEAFSNFEFESVPSDREEDMSSDLESSRPTLRRLTNISDADVSPPNDIEATGNPENPQDDAGVSDGDGIDDGANSNDGSMDVDAEGENSHSDSDATPSWHAAWNRDPFPGSGDNGGSPSQMTMGGARRLRLTARSSPCTLSTGCKLKCNLALAYDTAYHSQEWWLGIGRWSMPTSRSRWLSIVHSTGAVG